MRDRQRWIRGFINSDGATGAFNFLPSITIKFQFRLVDIFDVAAMHDAAYEDGGTERDRLNADLKLRAYMTAKGLRFWALVYFTFVRVFGESHFNYIQEGKRGYGDD
jgi:hypothetical protein